MITKRGSYIRVSADQAPTKEMVEFADERLGYHITLVADNMKKLAAALKDDIDTKEFAARAKEHDQSKNDPENRDEYVWCAWYHKHGEDDSVYPEGVKEKVRGATGRHIEKEKHHPQAHSAPSKMSTADLAEMVSDWYAMSIELKDDINEWVAKQKKEYNFTDEQEGMIDIMVDVLTPDGGVN